MGLPYNKLCKLFIGKKFSKAALRQETDVAPNTMTKIRIDEPVNVRIILRICDNLQYNISKIIDYFPKTE